MAYDTDNTFTLGVNDKGDNPKRPDYRGKLHIGGKTYRISAWLRTRQSDGAQFLSGKVEEDRDQRPAAPQTPAPSRPAARQEDGFAPLPPKKAPAAPLEDEDVPF